MGGVRIWQAMQYDQRHKSKHGEAHTHTHTHIHTHAKSEWRMVDAFAEWVLECRFVFRFLATWLLSFEGVWCSR